MVDEDNTNMIDTLEADIKYLKNMYKNLKIYQIDNLKTQMI